MRKFTPYLVLSVLVIIFITYSFKELRKIKDFNKESERWRYYYIKARVNLTNDSFQIYYDSAKISLNKLKQIR